jgi:hypothetical protein
MVRMPSVSAQQVPDGPIRKLFDELRRLHRTAGEPSTRTLAKAVAHGHATVHAALRGPRVPRWGLLELLVEQLDGDVGHFKQLWVDARDFEDPQDRRLPLPASAGTPAQNEPTRTAPPLVSATVGDLTAVTTDRMKAVLDHLEIRYLENEDTDLVARWERHTVLFTLEGPSDEILVIRTRADKTVPAADAARAQAVVNEWNHTRRFMKAYVGDPVDGDRLPIYAEMQTPMGAGIHDELLRELIDCGVVVALGFTDWLQHDVALF